MAHVLFLARYGRPDMRDASYDGGILTVFREEKVVIHCMRKFQKGKKKKDKGELGGRLVSRCGHIHGGGN